MPDFINLTYTKRANLQKTLNQYYFTSCYCETKEYPETINVNKNYLDLQTELEELKKIDVVSHWNLYIIDACKDWKIRNRYIALTPRLDDKFISELSKYCRCDECVSGVILIMEPGVSINPSCLRYGNRSTSIIFATLDYYVNNINKKNKKNNNTNNTIQDQTFVTNNILFRGSKILNCRESEENTKVKFTIPYIYTDVKEQSQLLANAWFHEKRDNMNVESGFIEIARPEYPFITRYFTKICVFKKRGNLDKIYQVGYACMPTGTFLTVMNDNIKEYCQCSRCVASYWNPFKYFMSVKSCLKKNNNFWCPELHKKTLAACKDAVVSIENSIKLLSQKEEEKKDQERIEKIHDFLIEIEKI